MYSIDTDLSALLQMLQKSRHSGRIRTQIPYGFAGLSGGYVFIDMSQGRATACYLVDAQRQLLLSGTEAIDVTSTMGILHWIAEQEYPKTTVSLPSVRVQTPGSPYSNPQLPAARPQSPGTQHTNTHLPAVRPQSPGTQHTNTYLPAIRPQSSSTQHTNTRLPALQPYSSSSQQTNAHLSALQPLRLTNMAGAYSYSFSAFVPERLIYIDSNLLGGLNRRLRRVLVLVDGQRSILKIASVLHPNEDGQQEVFDSLKQLAKMQIISIRKD